MVAVHLVPQHKDAKAWEGTDQFPILTMELHKYVHCSVHWSILLEFIGNLAEDKDEVPATLLRLR